MAELLPESTTQLDLVLHLLESTVSDRGPDTDSPASARIAGGLADCIRNLNPDLLTALPETIDEDSLIVASKSIVDVLELIGCPHSVEAYQIHMSRNPFSEATDSLMKTDLTEQKVELEAQIAELEAKASWGSDSISDDLDRLLGLSKEKLHSAKKELAAILRAVVSAKRQLDDVPSQSELSQYECRLSELNTNIGEKHRQTRKYFATYNALLEIKELMLKEISLLNSINSQFQDAITSPAGQTKLIDSMEGILKGIQRKLEKVQLGVREDQKSCNALRERYAAAVADQRRQFTLSKSFQEESAKNERLRAEVAAKESH